MTPPATLADFKSEFDRDFVFGTGLDSVRDKDITRAFTQAMMVFNIGLWDDDPSTKEAFLLASAHFLALLVQAAGGLSAGPTNAGAKSQGSGVIQQKSVGSVSATYMLPESLANEPTLSQFMRTAYGQQYLQVLVPQLVGPGYVVCGWDDVLAQ